MCPLPILCEYRIDNKSIHFNRQHLMLNSFLKLRMIKIDITVQSNHDCITCFHRGLDSCTRYVR